MSFFNKFSNCSGLFCNEWWHDGIINFTFGYIIILGRFSYNWFWLPRPCQLFSKAICKIFFIVTRSIVYVYYNFAKRLFIICNFFSRICALEKLSAPNSLLDWLVKVQLNSYLGTLAKCTLDGHRNYFKYFEDKFEQMFEKYFSSVLWSKMFTFFGETATFRDFKAINSVGEISDYLECSCMV